MPFALAGVIIVVVYLSVRRELGAKQAKPIVDFRPELECSFAPYIPGCVVSNVMRTYYEASPSDRYFPPYTTIGISQGALFVIAGEIGTMYRVKVDAAAGNTISGCAGRLLTIARDTDVWHVDMEQPFAPAEKRSEATAKTIHPGVPEFLDIAFVTEKNEIKLCSAINLPSHMKPSNIFCEEGAYLFEIVVTAAGCKSEISLLFEWGGEGGSTKVMRV
jgi:hypothetical protein